MYPSKQISSTTDIQLNLCPGKDYIKGTVNVNLSDSTCPISTVPLSNQECMSNPSLFIIFNFCIFYIITWHFFFRKKMCKTTISSKSLGCHQKSVMSLMNKLGFKALRAHLLFQILIVALTIIFSLYSIQIQKTFKHKFLKFWSFINLPWGHVRSHAKLGPDRFSRFDVY